MDEAERKNFLGIITSETERLTRLVNQVLDMAKIESGNAEWELVELDLKEVIEQSVAAASQLYKDKGASLETDFPAQVPAIVADRDRLVQVMLNLLSNAVKFVARDTGRVEVRLRQAGGELRVEVQDNGPGIRKEDQPVIFEKFRQGGSVLTDKPQGTGLGLPISRQIVEHFGGRLWVQSEPGRGATFLFTLPIQATQRTAQPEVGFAAARLDPACGSPATS
jgi:signal transduction histidine kinase